MSTERMSIKKRWSIRSGSVDSHRRFSKFQEDDDYDGEGRKSEGGLSTIIERNDSSLVSQKTDPLISLRGSLASEADKRSSITNDKRQSEAPLLPVLEVLSETPSDSYDNQTNSSNRSSLQLPAEKDNLPRNNSQISVMSAAKWRAAVHRKLYLISNYQLQQIYCTLKIFPC